MKRLGPSDMFVICIAFPYIPQNVLTPSYSVEKTYLWELQCKDIDLNPSWKQQKLNSMNKIGQIYKARGG